MVADGFDIAWSTLDAAARDAGFAVFGVTSAEPLWSLVPFLEDYYREGRASGFEHPMGEQRWHPRALFPSAQSLIAVALPYETESRQTLRRPPGRRGVVSRYAWGQDYHRVLHGRLADLSARLEALSGRKLRTQVCIDTSPLVDRAVALRAGIGWLGKNAMLITEKYGSYVFLGALLVDARMEPAPTQRVNGGPHVGCGECNRCLCACPTGALVRPGQLDSKKCLSGVTQSKGVIPSEYATKLGRRVWGCDTCQAVCPHNRNVASSAHCEFDPDPELAYPDLASLLSISSRRFKAVYGHMAVAWRGHQVLRRNAIIALANAHEVAAVPELLALLSDVRPEIRGTAAWALGRLDPVGSREQVSHAAAVEGDEAARQAMAWALVQVGARDSTGLL